MSQNLNLVNQPQPHRPYGHHHHRPRIHYRQPQSQSQRPHQQPEKYNNMNRHFQSHIDVSVGNNPNFNSNANTNADAMYDQSNHSPPIKLYDRSNHSEPLYSQPSLSTMPMPMPNAHEIIPNLWIGDVISSRDREFLTKAKINVVVNCTKDLPFEHDTNSIGQPIRYYRVPVHDNLDPKEIKRMAELLDEIIKMINYHYSHGDKILIHCMAGRQRSAIVALAYHIRYHSGDFQTSLNLFRQKRPVVFFPSMNFELSLRGVHHPPFEPP